MTTNEIKQKLDELKDDQEFMSKLAGCDSVDGMVALFAEEGIYFTEDELKRTMEMVSVGSTEGELDEDALENVSGGILMSTLCAAFLISCGIATASNIALMYLNRKR